MAEGWKRKKGQSGLVAGNAGGPFKEHSARMREFRKRHDLTPLSKISRREIINSMWPLLAVRKAGDAGGTVYYHDGAADWAALTPLAGVTACRFSSS